MKEKADEKNRILRAPQTKQTFYINYFFFLKEILNIERKKEKGII